MIKNKMKRLSKVINLILILSSLLLVGCTGSNKSAASETAPNKQPAVANARIVNIKVKNDILKLSLSNNSSADALVKLLEKGKITINMQDYGNFEKVGNLPKSLPTNDEQINTSAGDVILYQGNKITIYYDHNSWNLTRLGKINGATKEHLLKVLGSGDVTVELSL